MAHSEHMPALVELDRCASPQRPVPRDLRRLSLRRLAAKSRAPETMTKRRLEPDNWDDQAKGVRVQYRILVVMGKGSLDIRSLDQHTPRQICAYIKGGQNPLS